MKTITIQISDRAYDLFVKLAQNEFRSVEQQLLFSVFNQLYYTYPEEAIKNEAHDLLSTDKRGEYAQNDREGVYPLSET